MRKTWAVALKEVRQVARDPFTLLMLLGVPALMLLLYGYALNFDVRHVPLGVQDRDLSRESRALVSAFVNSTFFDLAAALPAGADLEAAAERRVARAFLVIPEGFAADLAAGRAAAAQILIDGTDARTADTVLAYATAIAADRNVGLLRAADPRAAAGGGPIDLRSRVWFNPELRSTVFLVPGLMGFILMLTAVLSTALSVVREIERGTMEQIRVSALRPAHLILGKTIPYLGISLAASGVILAAARVLFGVRVAGSLADVLIVTLLFLFGALSFGLLVSSVSISQAMAFQIGSLTSMLPAIFLSGFIFPIRSMPAPLQWITYAVPTRYYLVVMRGIILKGAGLAPYARPILFLVIFAVVVTSIAWVRLARGEAAA